MFSRICSTTTIVSLCHMNTSGQPHRDFPAEYLSWIHKGGLSWTANKIWLQINLYFNLFSGNFFTELLFWFFINQLLISYKKVIISYIFAVNFKKLIVQLHGEVSVLNTTMLEVKYSQINITTMTFRENKSILFAAWIHPIDLLGSNFIYTTY